MYYYPFEVTIKDKGIRNIIMSAYKLYTGIYANPEEYASGGNICRTKCFIRFSIYIQINNPQFKHVIVSQQVILLNTGSQELVKHFNVSHVYVYSSDVKIAL